MVIIPAFSILTNYIKQLSNVKKITLFAAPLVSVVCLFLAKSTFASHANCDVVTAVGFWFYLIVAIVWLVVGFLQYKNLPISKEGLSKVINGNK